MKKILFITFIMFSLNAQLVHAQPLQSNEPLEYESSNLSTEQFSQQTDQIKSLQSLRSTLSSSSYDSSGIPAFIDQPPNTFMTHALTPAQGQYSVRFYAQRPIGNTYDNNIINDNGAGHSFIGITDTFGNISYIGLYPSGSIKNSPWNIYSEAQMNDDKTHAYDESTQWYTISSSQYNVLLEHLREYVDGTYNIITNNCTDLVLNTADLLDIALDYSDWAYSNPQGFADTLLETELEYIFRHDDFEIIWEQESQYHDGWRFIQVKFKDGSQHYVYLSQKYDNEVLTGCSQEMLDIIN